MTVYTLSRLIEVTKQTLLSWSIAFPVPLTTRSPQVRTEVTDESCIMKHSSISSMYTHYICNLLKCYITFSETRGTVMTRSASPSWALAAYVMFHTLSWHRGIFYTEKRVLKCSYIWRSLLHTCALWESTTSKLKEVNSIAAVVGMVIAAGIEILYRQSHFVVATHGCQCSL